MANTNERTNQTIGLCVSSLHAEVETFGGYLTKVFLQAQSQEARHLVYPKQEIATSGGKKKIRGGSHVCLPNFGPDPSGSFVQHGYGRVANWDISQQTPSSVTLVLTINEDMVGRLRESQPGISQHLGVTSLLRYEIANVPEPHLTMSLKVKNNGSHTVRLSPGFHPYFQLPIACSAESVVIVNENSSKLVGACDPSYETPFSPAKGIAAKMGASAELVFGGTNVNRVTYWSDDPQKFICIEPTVCGASFSSMIAAPASQLVEPGQEQESAMHVSWNLVV